MSLDAVIFDYGKVLSLDQDPDGLAEMERLTGLGGSAFSDLYWKHRDAYDAGLVSGSSYWQIIGQDAGLEFTSHQLQALVAADNKSWSRINPTAVRWARELAEAGLKIGILSNMHRDLRDYLETHAEWVKEFHHAVFSCDVGMVKPQEPIYRLVVDGLGVTADRAVFLDDKQPNITAAERTGLHGVLVGDLPSAIREASDRFGLPAASLVSVA